MTVNMFLLIFFSVSLSALAQIALKLGMSGLPIQSALAEDWLSHRLAVDVFTNLYVLAGLSMYVLGALVWLLVLARMDVSMAYPFVGMGFIITMLLGAAILGESLTPARIVGTMLVVAGVTLISVQPTS